MTKLLPIEIHASGLSDRGRIRAENEDTILVDLENQLFVLADGMGGHSAGKVASQLATEVIRDYLVRWRNQNDFVWPFDPVDSWSQSFNHLSTALRIANVRVFNAAQLNDEHFDMGTTAIVALFEAGRCFVGHVGDSRGYLYRDGVLKRLTQDHSLVNQLIKAFDISEAEASARAGKNVLVQSLGLDDDVVPEVLEIEPRSGDLLLLCSDGLSDLCQETSILATLGHHAADLRETSQALVDLANAAGGRDNVSVILVGFS